MVRIVIRLHLSIWHQLVYEIRCGYYTPSKMDCHLIRNFVYLDHNPIAWLTWSET